VSNRMIRGIALRPFVSVFSNAFLLEITHFSAVIANQELFTMSHHYTIAAENGLNS